CVIRGRTTLHQARNSASRCGHLEGRDRIERDTVTEPDHALAGLSEEAAHKTGFEIRTVSEAEAWSNGPLEAAFVPVICRNETHCARLVNDWRGGQRRPGNRRRSNEDVRIRRCVCRWIDLPTRAVIQSEIRSHFPFI